MGAWTCLLRGSTRARLALIRKKQQKESLFSILKILALNLWEIMKFRAQEFLLGVKNFSEFVSEFVKPILINNDKVMEAVISESLFEKQNSSFDMLNRNWVFILLVSDITLPLLISIDFTYRQWSLWIIYLHRRRSIERKSFFILSA